MMTHYEYFFKKSLYFNELARFGQFIEYTRRPPYSTSIDEHDNDYNINWPYLCNVLKLLIPPNLICTLQDLVQATPILRDPLSSCKQCCCVFLRLLQSQSATCYIWATWSSFIKNPWWFILGSASPGSPIMKYQIMVVLSFSKLLQSRPCSSTLVLAPPRS